MSKEQRLLESYRQAAELHRIATAAVRKAQEESRRLGVPNVYSRDGRLYYDAAPPTDREPAAECVAGHKPFRSEIARGQRGSAAHAPQIPQRAEPTPMQATELDAEIRNGTIRLPNELQHWSERTVHVIVLEKETTAGTPKPRRTPHPSIAGKGRTIGDLVAPVVDESDWECLK